MAVTITDDTMTSDQTGHRAEWRPHAAADGAGAWICTGQPGRLLTRAQAAAAMALAELENAGRGGSPQARALRVELARTRGRARLYLVRPRGRAAGR